MVTYPKPASRLLIATARVVATYVRTAQLNPDELVALIERTHQLLQQYTEEEVAQMLQPSSETRVS